MRDLTQREHEVLLAMIDNAQELEPAAPFINGDQRAQWRTQAAGVQVSSMCECGSCPTINLVDQHGYEPQGTRTTLSAFRGEEGLILFIDGDQPSCLELYSHTDRRIEVFPHPSELEYPQP